LKLLIFTFNKSETSPYPLKAQWLLYRHGKGLGEVEYRLGQRRTESRTTETGEIELEGRQSKVVEEEMTRKLHSDLK
jgi:hypothetical protein